MANVTDMSRDQAKNFLRTLGEETCPSWTALEVKFRIGEKTETELDRAQGIGSLLRKRPASSTSDQGGPEETRVGFGRYLERTYKEVPQPYLDFIMEVDREMPMELSPKVSRLASWARSQKDAWTGRTPQLIVSGDGKDESVDYRRQCQVRHGAQAEAACFFCRARVCVQCIRPCTGRLPQCMVCAGEMGPAETRPANWTQKMEYAVETLMTSVLALQTQTADHETILAQLVESNPSAIEPEQEICEISPTESPSHVLVEVEEGTVVAKAGSAKPHPGEDPLGVFAEDKEEGGQARILREPEKP